MIKKLLLLPIICILLSSCGGGSGAGAADAVKLAAGLASQPDTPVTDMVNNAINAVAPSVTINAPTTILNASSPSLSACTGTTWDDCITLTANVSDPQNRSTNKQWSSNSPTCNDVTRQGDTIISSPVYCGEAYSCNFTYSINYSVPNVLGDIDNKVLNTTKTVYVNGFQCATGIGVDGYIIDADVFVDLNNNFTLDKNEPRTQTGPKGQFNFREPIKTGSPIILKGGIDYDTQLPMPEGYILIGSYDPNISNVISPLSTINYFAEGYIDLHKQIKIKNEFDILSSDPVSYHQYNYNSASAILEKNIQLTILSSVITKFSDDISYVKAWKIISAPIIKNNYSIDDIDSSNYIRHIFSSFLKELDYKISAEKLNLISESTENFLQSIKVVKGDLSHTIFFSIGIGEFGDNINKYIKGEVNTLNSY